jgi:hypothetical protein
MAASTSPTPNPVSRQDIAALVGVLAVLEGGLLAEQLDETTARKVADRLLREGLLVEDWAPHDLHQCLHDLNQRLRFALGEYDDPPPPMHAPPP